MRLAELEDGLGLGVVERGGRGHPPRQHHELRRSGRRPLRVGYGAFLGEGDGHLAGAVGVEEVEPRGAVVGDAGGVHVRVRVDEHGLPVGRPAEVRLLGPVFWGSVGWGGVRAYVGCSLSMLATLELHR